MLNPNGGESRILVTTYKFVLMCYINTYQQARCDRSFVIR